jgi:hypothetical protein
MKKIVSIVMLVLSTLMCSCIVLVGAGTLIPKGFVDFPCFAYYDEENQCVRLDGAVAPDEVLQEAHLQILLNHHEVGWQGAGCNAENPETDRVVMETSAIDLDFERQGDRLIVNGEPLATGDSFSHTNYWGLNPWVVEKIQFTNYGPIPICDTDVPARVVVIGSYGSELSPLKGTLLLLPILVLMIIFTTLLVSALRKKKHKKE